MSNDATTGPTSPSPVRTSTMLRARLSTAIVVIVTAWNRNDAASFMAVTAGYWNAVTTRLSPKATKSSRGTSMSPRDHHEANAGPSTTIPAASTAASSAQAPCSLHSPALVNAAPVRARRPAK